MFITEALLSNRLIGDGYIKSLEDYFEFCLMIKINSVRKKMLETFASLSGEKAFSQSSISNVFQS